MLTQESSLTQRSQAMHNAAEMKNYPENAQVLVAEMAAAAERHPGDAVAFQGAPGAYSHIAAREACPLGLHLPCFSFEDAFEAVSEGRAEIAVIPIENSQAGRVADIHLLLPHSELHIIGEHFVRVRHALLGRRGATIDDIREAVSHPQALGQCRMRLRDWGMRPIAYPDTAGAAAFVAHEGSDDQAAIASTFAAETYGLDVLAEGIEDAGHNTTRFVLLSRTPVEPDPAAGPLMTSFIFEVRNIPAALYKALGGFATNGVNMTKLESYQLDGSFNATRFYCEIEGSPKQPNVQLALEELGFHTKWVRILGTYAQARVRGVIAGQG